MRRASAIVPLLSVLALLLGAVSAASVAAAPSDTLALDAGIFSYDAAPNIAPASVDSLDRPPASALPDAVAGWSAGERASLSRLASDLVAPGSPPYGPTNPGPLHSLRNADEVVGSFRSGSYTQISLAEETTLYRAYGGSASEIGPYWTRTPPSGPLQSQLDSALNPAWGNTATDVAAIRVPAGTTIFEGVTAGQSLPGGGALLGGGNQVYIPRVDPAWLVGG